ncbi:MAG: hypothetical protein ACFCGT_10075 [Sandaracinaceae bacterium]
MPTSTRPQRRRLGALLVLALTLALLGTAGCGRPAAVDPPDRLGAPPETGFLVADLWDDGEAEVASYRVRERRYGSLRAGHATLITVKERFDADLLVKADGPRHERTLDAIKLNHVRTTPTGVYTYRQMASVFLARATGSPLKLATGSQEWCGLTAKRLVIRGAEAALETHSYFGSEGDRAYRLRVDERTVLADALPVWVRTLDLTRPGERTIRLVPEQLSSHAERPEVEEATVEVGEPTAIDVPAGPRRAVPVAVRGVGEETFWLDEAFPHVVVRWDRADGGEYALEWVKRAQYWALNADEDLGVLDPRRAARPATDLARESGEVVEGSPAR